MENEREEDSITTIEKYPYVNVSIEDEIKYWNSFEDYYPTQYTDLTFTENDIQVFKQFKEEIKLFSNEKEEFSKLKEIEKVIMLSNPILFKFWVAREKDNLKAKEMWSKSIEFRVKMNLRGDNLETEFKEYIDNAYSLFHGKDRKGRIVFYMVTKVLNDKTWDPEHFQRFCFWQMENALRLFAADDIRDYDLMQLAIIHDRSDKKSVDDQIMARAKEVGQISGDNWPETLGKYYMLNSNMTIAFIVNFFSYLYGSRTMSKFRMISSNDELYDEIDRSQLWTGVGGYTHFKFMKN